MIFRGFGKIISNGHFLLRQGNIFFSVQFNISYLPIFTIHLLAVFTTTLFLQKVYCACIIGAYDNAYDSLSTRKSCWNLNLLRTRQQCSFLAIKSTKKKSYNWVVQSHNGLLFFLSFTVKRCYFPSYLSFLKYLSENVVILFWQKDSFSASDFNCTFSKQKIMKLNHIQKS